MLKWYALRPPRECAILRLPIAFTESVHSPGLGQFYRGLSPMITVILPATIARWRAVLRGCGCLHTLCRISIYFAPRPPIYGKFWISHEVEATVAAKRNSAIRVGHGRRISPAKFKRGRGAKYKALGHELRRIYVGIDICF